MTRYDVMKHWSLGFAAAIVPRVGMDKDGNEHWQAGYASGYQFREEKNRLLNEYLVSTGREPQARFGLATSPPTEEARDA